MRREKRVSLVMPNTSIIKSLASKKKYWADILFPFLQSIVMSLFILALAQPQLPLREEVVKQQGIDIILAMDISASMLSQDFKPNRLTVSKELAATFIDRRSYDRIGLVTFSGEAITNCPLTTDYTSLKNILYSVKNGTLEDGTAIGVGLATAVARLKDNPNKSKIIILLTDGDDDGNGFVTPIDAANLAKQFGIKVYTIGVGKYGQALSPKSIDKFGEINYEMQAVTINEGLLKQISMTTDGGIFYRATDASSFGRIYDDIDKLEKNTIDTLTYKRQKIVVLPLLLFALSIIVVNFILKNTIFKIFP